MVVISIPTCGSFPIVIVPCLAALKFLKYNVLSKTLPKVSIIQCTHNRMFWGFELAYYSCLNIPLLHQLIGLINFNNSGICGHPLPQNYFPMVRLRCFLLNIYFCQNHWSFYTFTYHGRQNSLMNYTSLCCHVCFDFCKLKSYMLHVS